MKIFGPLYDLALRWARHKRATAFLCGLSFSESMFFPIPPDVMLAPMSLAQPHRAWYFALLTTITSLLGGIAGYALGYFAFDTWVVPLITDTHYAVKLDHVTKWFSDYGLWIVLLAGFSPIPYKVFTITAGALQMAFIPFVIASFIGRGARFFLVAGLMRWGGAPMETKLKEYVEILGWAVVIAAVIAYLILR